MSSILDPRASRLDPAASPAPPGARETVGPLRGESPASPAAVAPASPEIRIQVENLRFFYGRQLALRGIDLPIHSRRVTAFIGPSGCGKSTLLRTMNRMFELYPRQRSEGRVLLDGENVLDPDYDLNLLRRKVGMVFQTPTPFPMSIFDNIAFGVRLYERLSPADLRERVEWALRKAALWDEVKDKLKQTGKGLSGGQQQRLCMARAIAVKPEVLLLDEPTSALDPIATAAIEELVRELAAEYTVAIVTHNLQQAGRISDYVAFLFLGELVEFDTTAAMMTHPREKRTEDYVSGRFG